VQVELSRERHKMWLPAR